MAALRAKDRATPFSKKHRKYWIPVTGGMLLIGALNVGLGMCSYDPPPSQHERIKLTLPPSEFTREAPSIDGSASGSGSGTIVDRARASGSIDASPVPDAGVADAPGS